MSELATEALPESVTVIDSHTEGEPTRVVVAGWPQPAGATMAERRDYLRRHQDELRRAVVCEPRGHEAVVGALLVPPVEPGSLAGVIFFDNTGTLGMCGHGLIGVARTLESLGRLSSSVARLDTPVGRVGVELHDDASVTIQNVTAYCHARDVSVDVAGVGRVTGDVAWGGNWFFLTQLPGEPIEMGNLANLTRATLRIKDALRAAGVSGAEGAVVDHVEVFGPAGRADADSRNFVLCPSGAYDRSPCGTGTSAKLAVLHARGQLALGQQWRQESVSGGLFTGWLSEEQGRLIPYIRGRAFITGEARLRFDPRDPFRAGLGVA